MRLEGVLYQSADCLLVNVPLFSHRYTYGKPVQGKVEIAVMTFSQAVDESFTSSEMQNLSHWVSEQIGDQTISCAGNVFLPP